MSALRPALLANHHPPLHGLRVLAIVAIVQLHVSTGFNRWQLMGTGHPIYRVSMALWFAMDLFFLLSGFLIGSMLLRDDAAVTPSGAARFWGRRAFRIIPAYYVVLTALVLVGPLDAARRAALWHEYAYVTNYFVTEGPPIMIWAWSLCVEEHFYLAVPLLVGALSWLPTPRSRAAALTALWASGVVLRVATVLVHHRTETFEQLFVDVYPRTHLRYDILVAGVLLAWVERHHGPRLDELFARPAVRRGALALSALALVFLLVHLPLATPLRCALEWGGLTAVFYVPLVLWLLHHRGGVARFLGHPAFRYVATFGYGIYLVHLAVIEHLLPPVLLPPIVEYARTHGGPPALGVLWLIALATALVLSLLVSAALHLLVEKPALVLRDRLLPGER